MTPEALTAFLHEHIPLTLAMGVCAESVDPISLRAPLAPNINQQSTAFGGSIATLAIAAGWAWLRVRLDSGVKIVIMSAQLEYQRPIDIDLTAVCRGVADDEWAAFTERLDRKGKTGLALNVEVFGHPDEPAFQMGAVFVAIA